jgi:chromosome partitioning protein
MYVLAVVNHKGGVGKTNVSGNLAAEAAATGRRVLAVDLDPQHTLTTWMTDYVPGIAGSAEAMGYGADPVPVADLVRQIEAFGCDLLPADLAKLDAVAKQLAADASQVFRLADALVSVADRYDFVVVDCPPQLGSLTQAAVAASQGVLIPINGAEALEGYLELDQFLERMRRIAPVKILGTVLTMNRPRTQHFQEIADGLRSIGNLVPATVGLSVDASELHSRHVPARMHKKNGRSHRDYQALAKQVLDRAGVGGAAA